MAADLSLEGLRAVVDGIPVLVSYVDREQRYQFNNRMYEEWFGHSPDEIQGRHIRDVLGPAAYEEIQPYVEAALAGHEVRFERWLDYRVAGRAWVEAHYVPHRGADGAVLGFFAAIHDITGFKQDEEKIRLQSEELRAVMEATPAALWIAHDPDCQQITGNRVGNDLLRAPAGTNLSKSNSDPEPVRHFRVMKDGVELPPDELPIQRAARGEEIRDFEEELVFDDGSRVHLLGNAVPLYGPGGEVSGAVGAFVDVTHLKEVEEQLRHADRRKDEFLATLAHELRNPLAPIRTAVQVMHLLDPGDPQFRRMRDVVERQAEQLTRLVDGLLDLSRVGMGKITLRRETLDLRAVVERAVESSRPLIDERRHRLTIVLPSEPLSVDGDATRLVQVVSNLLNNAAKYTDQGGSIRLTVEEHDGEARIRVEDDGIGIAVESLHQVFDLFAQADDALGRAQGGLGIGLSLVKSLVSLHGGSVHAASAGPGKGSAFTVRLPLLSGALAPG